MKFPAPAPVKLASFKLIGRLGKIKGLKGEIRLQIAKSRSVLPDPLTVIYLSESTNFIPYVLSGYVHSVRDILIRITGAESPEKISKFVGRDVYLPSDQLARDSFSFLDLQGYMANDVHHGILGVIKRVEEYPQQLIAVIDFSGTDVLVPLTGDIIKNIDHSTSVILLDLPSGLLEVYTVQE